MMTVDTRAAAPAVVRPFPFVNDWGRGCWVARPNGKADREYVYQRDFLRGVAHKASGTLRYSSDELGGPGWVVARDRRGIRALIAVTEFGWADLGEVPPADVLRVVRAGAPGEPGSWDGSRCGQCERPVFGPDCEPCALEAGERERAAADRAAAPDVEPF